jgi:hypothetical protein
MEISNEVMTAVYGTATTLLLGGLAAIGKAIKAYLETSSKKLSRAQEIDERTELLYVLTRFSRVSHAAVERSYVKLQKAAGTWGPEQQAEAKKQAVSLTKQMLGSVNLAELTEKFGDVDQLIGSFLEGTKDE